MDLRKSYIDTIHYKIGDKLFNLLQFKNHNSIIIHGISKSGKTTLIKSILNDLSNKTQVKKNIDYHVTIYSNFYYFNSNTIFHKLRFIQYIKDIIGSYDYYNNKIKYIVIDNYENISEYIQNCLKVVIEKSYLTTKFIFITNNLSKIIPAIKSRCISVRLPSPTIYDKMIYLKYKKKNTINDFLLYEKCKKNDLFTLLTKNYNNDKLKEYTDIIILFFKSKMNLSLLKKIRNISCEVKSIDIPINQLLIKILDQLFEHNLFNKDIIKIISEYEHSLQFSYREIIYIESLILNLYKVINHK